MRTPSKPKELTKAQIRASAIKELTWRGYTVWVQNNLAVRGRKFIGKRGQADIMGFRNKDGLYWLARSKPLTTSYPMIKSSSSTT